MRAKTRKLGSQSNQADYFFNGESKRNSRFFLSPYHMMEAKHNLEIANAKVKRGEKLKLHDFVQKAWDCGCCVTVCEVPPKVNYDTMERDRVDHLNRKSTRKRRKFMEVDGKLHYPDATGRYAVDA